MVRIDAVTINKLGNVASATKLRFGPRGVVLLGRNGTGKTTLLNLLVSLLQGKWDSLHDSDYDVTFDLTCSDDVRLHVSLKATTEHENEANSENEQPGLLSTLIKGRQYSAHIELYRPEEPQPTIVSSRDGRTEYVFPDKKTEHNNLSPKDGWRLLLPPFRSHLTQSIWFGELFFLANQITRFDEGLSYFNLLVAENSKGMLLFASRRNGARQFSADMSASRFIGSLLAKQLVDDFVVGQSANNEGHTDANKIRYLRTFCDLAGFDSADITSNLDERISTDSREMITLRPIRYVVHSHNTVMHHRHLSFGEQRLLAFLHYLDSCEGLVIADELVNGMHYDWITACLQMLETRQAFLSSQNPLLFDFLEFDSAEDVASRFIICKHDDKRGFVWSNMSHDDAQELYETYKTGIQHVGEILRTRGYW